MGTFYTKGHKAIKSRLFKELLLIAVIYYFIVAIKLNQLVQFEKKGLLITRYLIMACYTAGLIFLITTANTVSALFSCGFVPD